MFYRGRILAFGAIITLALASGVALVSGVEHQLSGVATTAMLLERTSECHIEFQLVGSNQRTQKPMECGAALAFQQRIGADRIQILPQRLRAASIRRAVGRAARSQGGRRQGARFGQDRRGDCRRLRSEQSRRRASALLTASYGGPERLSHFRTGPAVARSRRQSAHDLGRIQRRTTVRPRAVAEPDAMWASRESANLDYASVIPASNPAMARPEAAVTPRSTVHSTPTFGKRNAVRLNR